MPLSSPHHVRALIYADIFDYPLTEAELEKYAINHNSPSAVTTIHPLKKDGYYFLPGRENLVEVRQRRTVISQGKLLKAKRVASLLGKLPNLLGVFVTGNVAMDNADIKDDIDLFIITQTNRLWTTRLMVTILLEMLGKRRRPHGSANTVQDKICTNMWLDTSALAIPTPKRNLYTAHEVVQVKPLINKDHIYERFLTANGWVKDYLPHISLPKKVDIRQQENTPQKHWLETLAYGTQYRYMKPHITRELISLHTAFFHPRDTGRKILDCYEKKLAYPVK